MHDIVHDFAQFLTKKEYVVMEVGKVSEETKLLDASTRHLTLAIEYRGRFPALNFSEDNEKNLRTLIILPHFRYMRRTHDSSQFLHLTHLRTFSVCGLEKLSSDVGRLIHLRYLDLSQNDLERLPDTMFGLYNLQILILSECRLQTLQNDVGKLTQLRYLDLSRNKNLSKLPDMLCNLCNLQTLLLSSCGLKKLPGDFGKLAQLRTLDLESNHLVEFPITFGDLCSLQHLDLRACKIRRLPEVVGKLVDLEHLNLSEYNEAVIDMICNLPNLQSLDLSRCLQMKLPDDVGKIRNLRYLNLSHNKNLRELPDTLCELCNLEVLNLHLCSSLEKLPEHIGKLSCLRELNLRGNYSLKELPESVGDLYNLQKLDISSCSELQRLPEAMCNLYNLQRLDIKSCSRLRRFPQGVGKLVNLRYLDYCWCDQLEGLPKALGELDCLQPADVLFVPKDKKAYLDFEDVKSLKAEVDCCRVDGCANLTSADEQKKLGRLVEGLEGLHLRFRNDKELRKWSREQHGIQHDNEILEAFDPHPNLARLKIENYLGTNISPNWIMSSRHLKEVRLIGCVYCEILPPLGELPFLESVTISGMKRVKKVGLEFLGIPEHRDESGATKLSFVSFPRLETLRFSMMSQWEDWEGSAIATDDTELTIMPLLRSLELWRCRSLKALPDILPLVPLKELHINQCKILQQFCQKETGKEWGKISHIRKITIDRKTLREDHVWMQKDDVVSEISQTDDVIDLSPLFSEQII